MFLCAKTEKLFENSKDCKLKPNLSIIHFQLSITVEINKRFIILKFNG
jgi:hypothetical protein